MLLVDANVLLYAANEDAHDHAVSRAWLESALTGTMPLGLAWPVLLAFLRLSTSRSAFRTPLDVGSACDEVRAWLNAPAAVVVEPTSRHGDVLAGLLADAGTAGNLVNDAHLAALAIEHGATIVSFDRDFGRFVGVRSLRPGSS